MALINKVAFISFLSPRPFLVRSTKDIPASYQCDRNQLTWVPIRRRRSIPIRCSDDISPQESTGSSYGNPKFEPESGKDAFGRDPRKETEYWMGAARTVLDSQEVKDAIANQNRDNGDGLTDEQRAYMEFIKKLDEKSDS